MIWYVTKALLGFVATLLVAAMLIVALTPGAGGGSLGDLLIFNLGMSASLNASVGALLADRLAVTVPLVVLAIIVTVLVGGAIGWGAGQRPGSWLDRALGGLAQAVAAIPGFWLGMLLVLLFSAVLRLLPPGGFVPWSQSFGGALASLLLPALALALPQAGLLALLVRDTLAGISGSAYFTALGARGVSRSEALRAHGWRMALSKVLAGLGAMLGALIAGALVVESVFYLPGLGRLSFDAVTAGDMPLLRGALFIVVLLIAGTLFLIRLGRLLAEPPLPAGSGA